MRILAEAVAGLALQLEVVSPRGGVLDGACALARLHADGRIRPQDGLIWVDED